MKNMYRFLITFIFICICTNVYAENLNFKDNIAGIINKQVILNSDLQRHISLLKLLINLNRVINIKKYSLNDLMSARLQLRMAVRNKVKVQDLEVRSIYMHFAIRNKLSLSEYSILIKEHNLYENEVRKFIKESLLIEKLHEKILSKRMRMSQSEMIDFLTFSNNNMVKYDLQLHKIIKIKLRKNKISENNFKIIKNFINISNKKSYKIKSLIKKTKNIKTKTLYLDPLKRYAPGFKIMMLEHLNKKIFGPIYNKKNITFFIITKRKKKADINDADYKIGHMIIKKKTRYQGIKNSIRVKKGIRLLNNIEIKIRRNANKNLYKKIFRPNFKEFWINKISLSKFLLKDIDCLDRGEVTRIFETKRGWHLIMLIDKKISKQTNTYKNLIPHMKAKKLSKLRTRWLRKVKKGIYIKSYIK